MKPIITYEWHCGEVIERTIVIYRHYSHYILQSERPHPKATEGELASTPATFRCYACLRNRGRRKLGGIILGKRVCRLCYPYVDNNAIKALIAFDRWHGFDYERSKTHPLRSHRRWKILGKGKSDGIKGML